jgi:hypothetical protein
MRLETWIATTALAAALGLATGGRADAQVFRVGAGIAPKPFIGAGGPVNVTSANAPATATFATSHAYASGYNGATSGYIPPYSYYAALPPAPARIYVDYANSGFNFYGKPYGHPNDRWSWSAMSSDQGSMNRYYYPPVR